MMSEEFKKKYTKIVGFINLFLGFACLCVMAFHPYIEKDMTRALFIGIMGLYSFIVGIWCLESKSEV